MGAAGDINGNCARCHGSLTADGVCEHCSVNYGGPPRSPNFVGLKHPTTGSKATLPEQNNHICKGGASSTTGTSSTSKLIRAIENETCIVDSDWSQKARQPGCNSSNSPRFLEETKKNTICDRNDRTTVCEESDKLKQAEKKAVANSSPEDSQEMKTRVVQSLQNLDNAVECNEHLTWLSKYQIMLYPDLEKLLKRLAGVTECDVEILVSAISSEPRWSSKNVNQKYHCLDFVREFSGEVIKAIAFYREIPPLFFDIPSSESHTDGGTRECMLTSVLANMITGMFFSLQFIAPYYETGRRPAEATRAIAPPTFKCQNARTGATRVWTISRVSFLTKCFSNGVYYNLLFLDPVDVTLAASLRSLLLGDEYRIPLAKANHVAGAVSSILFMTALTAGHFLDDAEAHLRRLTTFDTNRTVSFEEEIKTSQELHELLDLWREVRRRVLAAKLLTANITTHAFIVKEGLQDLVDASLRKVREMIEYDLERLDDIVEKTNVHISLIFNMATLRDSRAALEESKAANSSARSMQRMTYLAFVFLPIQLASTMLGMNLEIITKETNQPSVWSFVILTFGLLGSTLSALIIWSNRDLTLLTGLRVTPLKRATFQHTKT